MRSLILVVFMVTVVTAQFELQDITGCTNALKPCDQFTKSKTVEPSSECCNRLHDVLKKARTCACSTYGSAHFLLAKGYDIKAVLSLPKLCNLNFDLQAECKVATSRMLEERCSRSILGLQLCGELSNPRP